MPNRKYGPVVFMFLPIFFISLNIGLGSVSRLLGSSKPSKRKNGLTLLNKRIKIPAPIPQKKQETIRIVKAVPPSAVL